MRFGPTISRLFWFLQAAILCMTMTALSAAIADDNIELEPIFEGTEFGGFGIGCTRIELEFTGQLFYRASGQRKKPLLNADFICSGPWHDPEPCNVQIESDGSFRGFSVAWDHVLTITKRNGKTKVKHRPGRAWVTISAPGCMDKEITVDRLWRHRKIVLKCKKSPPQIGVQSNNRLNQPPGGGTRLAPQATRLRTATGYPGR